LRSSQLHPVLCNTTVVARTGQPSRDRVAAARRSFAILDVLAEQGSLGTNEIARRAGVTASTVSRQLGTLVEAGLVEHEPATGRYRLGVRLVALGQAVLARLDVRELARPHLEALVAEVGETATLSVPAEPDAITIDVAVSSSYVRGDSRLGRPSIAHATAAGKVMLACTGRRPEPPLAAYTPRTITDPDQLEAELQRISRRGWADAFEEREPELNAIAAPVWSSPRTLAGIVALQGPAGRFGRAVAREALPLLCEHVEAISSALGAEAGESRVAAGRSG
jgi:DNA-binding IclR family transcriptional regulator